MIAGSRQKQEVPGPERCCFLVPRYPRMLIACALCSGRRSRTVPLPSSITSIGSHVLGSRQIALVFISRHLFEGVLVRAGFPLNV